MKRLTFLITALLLTMASWAQPEMMPRRVLVASPQAPQAYYAMWDGSNRADYEWDAYPTYDAYENMMHQFAEEHAACRTEAERHHPEYNDTQSGQVEEYRRKSFGPDDDAQEYGDDIDELVLCGIGESGHDAALFNEVAEHQHTE